MLSLVRVSLIFSLLVIGCGPGLLTSLNNPSAGPTPIPMQVSGLTIWYQADGLTGAAGSAVNLWSDLTGKSNHATIGTAPVLALTSANTTGTMPLPNNRPVVNFSSAKFLQTGPIPALNTGTQTWFVVANSTAGAAQAFVASKYTSGAGANSNKMFFLGYNAGGNHAANVYRSDTSLAAAVGALTAVAGTYRIFGLITRSNADLEMYYDGTQLGTTQPGASITPNTHVSTFIGQEDTGTLPLTGDIGEVLIYARELSITEKRRIECYLQARYLTMALPYSCANYQ